MTFPKLSLKSRMPMAVAALCTLLGAGPAQAAARDLPGELAGLSYTNSSPARIHVAQADSAQLMVRIQQLEEQVRVLNGQVEGLTFQMTQMQTIIERLESSSGAGQAVPDTAPAAEAAPEADVPMTDIPEQGVQPLPGEVEFDPTFDDGTGAEGEVGASGDPLLGTGSEGGIDLATGQPIDLNYDPATAESGNADADAQFAAGYEAMVRGDYVFAEEQFSQFLELYPDNPQATEAANWLGDAMLQRGAYSEAADVLLTAFQEAPESPRAPDLLLKLGISLAGAGERETACRTFGEVERRFPDQPAAFEARLAEVKANAECPPA